MLEIMQHAMSLKVPILGAYTQSLTRIQIL